MVKLIELMKELFDKKDRKMEKVDTVSFFSVSGILHIEYGIGGQN